MPWTTIHLTVTTPLFNAGADTEPGHDDGGGGFRVSSLRGALRYWWRALAGIGIGNNVDSLARLERRVFGATDHASPVKLRIADSPTPVTNPTPDWLNGPHSQWLIYLLGQGRGDLKTRTISTPFLPPDTPIRLQARFGPDEPAAALVLAALWLLCTYGGAGARTRRGFGGLRITGVDGDLPAPWAPDTLVSPGLDFYQNITHLWPTSPVTDCMRSLKTIADRDRTGDTAVPFIVATDTTLPRYPTFSKKHTQAALSRGEPFDSWQRVLTDTGEQLRHFRARKAAPGAGYRPEIKTPEWIDVVCGQGTHFPLGALGLPVVYKQGRVVNAYGPGGELRRASPLWLRPVGADPDWRLLSFAFHSTFLPADTQIQLRHGAQRKDLTVDHDDVITRTGEWITGLRNDEDFTQKLLP
jgi:CRISPR-associated protein Cmr1